MMKLAEVPAPIPGPGEVLLDVAATAVNRADLLQRQGNYAPPPGASSILGLECSGTVAALGPGVSDWQIGDQVCALLSGGGYAEQVVVPVGQLLPIPAGIDLVSAAALPEVTCTVWSNLVSAGRLSRDETLLIHGGGSGIGTMAIQVGKALGARVAVTASRAETLQACRELGADIAINYREQDFVAEIRNATGGRGADVILDVVGAKYLSRNLSALAPDARLVVIGMQGGTTAELNLGAMMTKRATLIAATLRARPATGPHSKAEVVSQVRDHLWPLLEGGRIHPVIDRVLPLAEVAAAHTAVADGGHHGKIVLTVSNASGSPKTSSEQGESS